MTSTRKGSPQQATEPPTRHVGRHRSPTRATARLQHTVAQQADLQHAHAGLPERRAAGGVRATHAHLAGAREAAAAAAAAQTAPPRAASRPRARLVAPARRRTFFVFAAEGGGVQAAALVAARTSGDRELGRLPHGLTGVDPGSHEDDWTRGARQRRALDSRAACQRLTCAMESACSMVHAVRL